MRQINKSTETFPLMLNFSKAKPMEIVNAEDIAMVYDPVKQVTLYMGGGGGSKSASRSQTTTKRTFTGTDARTNKAHYIEDNVYGADD